MLLKFFGLMAFITSTISLFPQIIKTYQSKSAADLSALMLLNFFICSVCWLCYGLMTNDLAVWLTNLVMVICSLILGYLKLKYK